MASNEVEKITEPVSIEEVEGVKSYLIPEVEAAVVNLAKSGEIQQLQHSLPAGNSISGVPEGQSFLESSSNGQHDSGENEEITGQADESITTISNQVNDESIKEAGLDAVMEGRVTPGIEAGEQISTPEVSLVQDDAAAPEKCLENGSKATSFSYGVEGRELEPENEAAESAEEAQICDGIPDKAVDADTVVGRTVNPESREEVNQQKEAVAEAEKQVESEYRELGEPAVAESVTKSNDGSETDADKQEQIHESDSKEAPMLHVVGTSNEDDTVKKEESSKETTTVDADAADGGKVEESVKEGTMEDLQIVNQSTSKEFIATPVESEVAVKENAEEIGVEEEEKAPAEIDSHIENESSTREPATAELVTKDGETGAEKQEEIVQPNSSEARTVHHDAGTSNEEEQAPSKEDAPDAHKTELETKSNDDDTVKQEGTPSTLDVDEKPCIETSEETGITRPVASPEDKKEEADVVSNKDTTETVDESSIPCIEATQDHETTDLPVDSNEKSKGLERVAEISHDKKSKAADEVGQLVTPVSVPEAEEKADIPKEDDNADLSNEATDTIEQSNRENLRAAPEAALQTSPEVEKTEALPMVDKESEKGESKSEGIEEEEVEKKTEQGETVERAIEVPQVGSEDAEAVQEGIGDHSTYETEHKPVDEPVPATKDQGSLEEIAEVSNNDEPEAGEVQQVEKLVSSAPSEPKVNGSPSGKSDDAFEEKEDKPKEESKEALFNESHATDSIEQVPAEDLHKVEHNVELSNEEVLEQSETTAKTVVNETDEITEKEEPKGNKVESVPQEEKEQETEIPAENPEKPVTEHEITTEGSRAITVEDDKAKVVEKEVPEIIQPAEEATELGKTMDEKEHPTEEIPEEIQKEKVVEPVLGEGEKESVPEEKALAEPEVVEATHTTQQGNMMVEGTEKPLLGSLATGLAEESKETSNKEIIEIPAAALQEEEAKGDVESVAAESEAIPDQLQGEKHVVQSSEIPSHEDDYETKAMIENTEEEKTKDVMVSQPDTPDDPLELHTTEEMSLKEVQPRELDAEASIGNNPYKEEIKEASEVVEATVEDKLTDDKSIEEKPDEQYQAEPHAMLAKEEEEKESLTETKGDSCLHKEQVKSHEDATKEVPVPDQTDQTQEASDSSRNEAPKDGEVPAIQALSEEPEVLQDESKQTEEECKTEEVEKETEVKAILEEVNAPSADITEEVREIPEAVVAENMPKQTEEHEVDALVDKADKQVEKTDDISEPETTATTTEISDGTPEDKSKQAEEEPAEQQEAPELIITRQVDPRVEDVHESKKVHKGDDTAVATEEPTAVPALTIMAEDEPKKEIEEASRPVKQVSSEFQVSELKPEVEKGSQETQGSAITEESREVSEVVPISGSQETQPPLKQNELSHPESLPVEKPEAKEVEDESKPRDEEASLMKEESIVGLGHQKEVHEEKEEASELVSNLEFTGFIQPEQLAQQVTTECPTVKEEMKAAAEPLERTIDLGTITKKEILESASEGSSQEVIADREDNAVGETQREEPAAEHATMEKEIIQESKPESEHKAERLSAEEIEPKVIQTEMVIHQKNIPSEGDVKIVEEEEDKVETEEAKAKAPAVIDKELGTQMSQRDLPVKIVEEVTKEEQSSTPTPENQISTEAKPSNPAKISLFDIMAKSTREMQVVLDSAEEKEPKAAMTEEETKAAQAEPEKAKSDGEKERDEEPEEDEHDKGEEHHKNDSSSDGLLIAEASKEAEVKVVTTPQKKSHNILSEVGSKVKHSISKVKKVITGKSSHQPKQNSPKQHSPK